jgi:hypothetical protein
MTPEQVRPIEPKILKPRSSASSISRTAICCWRSSLTDSWIERLRKPTDEMVDRVAVSPSPDAVGSQQGSRPTTRGCAGCQHERPPSHVLLGVAVSARLALPDAIADLVRPDVQFPPSKLNFKWSKGGDEVKLAQDISFWPHTNGYSPCTAAPTSYSSTAEQGRSACCPAAWRPVVDQYNDKGQWVGCLKPEDAAAIDMSKVVYLEGPAGSVTIHNCRTLHYSKANWSDTRAVAAQRLLAADAMPYTTTRCSRATWAQSCAASRRAGPTTTRVHACCHPTGRRLHSIFALQQEEDWSKVWPRWRPAA